MAILSNIPEGMEPCPQCHCFSLACKCIPAPTTQPAEGESGIEDLLVRSGHTFFVDENGANRSYELTRSDAKYINNRILEVFHRGQESALGAVVEKGRLEFKRGQLVMRERAAELCNKNFDLSNYEYRDAIRSLQPVKE